MKCNEQCGGASVRSWHVTKPSRFRWTIRRVFWLLLIVWLAYLAWAFPAAQGAEPDPPVYAIVYVDGSVGLYACELDMLACLGACEGPVLWAGPVDLEQALLFGIRPRLCTHVDSFGSES